MRIKIETRIKFCRKRMGRRQAKLHHRDIGWVLRNECFSVKVEKDIAGRRKKRCSGVTQQTLSTGKLPILT